MSNEIQYIGPMTQFPNYNLRQLSVRQPWASLIASGRKSIELRSWSTSYRGPVLIVSGAKPWAGEHGYELGPLGVTLCVVDLVDVRSVQPGDEVAACIVPPPGYGYAWVLANPRVVEQRRVRGRVGLTGVPSEWHSSLLTSAPETDH